MRESAARTGEGGREHSGHLLRGGRGEPLQDFSPVCIMESLRLTEELSKEPQHTPPHENSAHNVLLCVLWHRCPCPNARTVVPMPASGTQTPQRAPRGREFRSG